MNAYDPWCASQHRSPDRPLLLGGYALAIHNGCTRTGISASFDSYLIPKLIVDSVPQSGEAPKAKVMLHGLPWSEISRQHAPGDATLEHIKNRVRNGPQIDLPLSSTCLRRRKQRFNQPPTAPPSDRSDRESSHHHTPCILRQVLRPSAGSHVDFCD